MPNAQWMRNPDMQSINHFGLVSADPPRPISRSSSRHSHSSNPACATTQNAFPPAAAAVAVCASTDSMYMRSLRASADIQRVRSSADSLLATGLQQQQPQLQPAEGLLQPRPSSSSPDKRHHMSSRSHRHHHRSSNRHSTGGQHHPHTSAAAGLQQGLAPVHQVAAAAAGQQQASRGSSGGAGKKLSDTRPSQRQQQESKQELQKQQLQPLSHDKQSR